MFLFHLLLFTQPFFVARDDHKTRLWTQPWEHFWRERHQQSRRQFPPPVWSRQTPNTRSSVSPTVLGPFAASYLSLLGSGPAALGRGGGGCHLNLHVFRHLSLIHHGSWRRARGPRSYIRQWGQDERASTCFIASVLRRSHPPFFFPLLSGFLILPTIICFLSIISLGSPEHSWWRRNRSVCMGFVFHRQRYIIWKSFSLMVPDLVWMLLCVSKMDIITQRDASRHYISPQLFLHFTMRWRKSGGWMFLKSTFRSLCSGTSIRMSESGAFKDSLILCKFILEPPTARWYWLKCVPQILQQLYLYQKPFRGETFILRLHSGSLFEAWENPIESGEL